MTIEEAVKKQLKIYQRWDSTNAGTAGYRFGCLSALAAIAGWDDLEELENELNALAEKELKS